MKPRKTRKPRSPRVVKHRTRHPRVVKETVAHSVRPVAVAPVYYGMQPSFPKRRDPFSPEELAGLEIPAFLKRELPQVTA